MDNPSINMFCSPTPVIAGPGDGNPADDNALTVTAVNPNPVAGNFNGNVTLTGTGFTDNGNEQINMIGAGSNYLFAAFTSSTSCSFALNAANYAAGVYTIEYICNNGTATYPGTFTIL